MKSITILIQSFQVLNLSQGLRYTLRYKYPFVLILLLAALASGQARAQNYIVNYYGFNVGAQDLVYHAAQKQFMINSITDGQLGYINSEAQYRPLLKEELLIGATAMKIRGNTLYAVTNRLNAANANENGNQPRLIKLNLTTKKVESVVELGSLFKGAHFVADLTIDPEGIVYIVDALSPVIYKIDQSGRGSIFLESDFLKSENGQVKAIAYHKHEYLLVAVDREILKVDLKTGAVFMVDVDTEFESINSLHFTKEYLLVVSEGGQHGKVHILNTSNSWLAGKVLRTDAWEYKNPINIEFVDNRIYILDSEANKVASSDFSVRIIDLNKLPASRKRKARILAGDVTILKKDF